MSPPIARIILYVRDIGKVAAFYQLHFGMRQSGTAREGWLELASRGGGATIALHKAAVSQKRGTAIKIVFGVRNIAQFKERCRRNGFIFGPIHEAEGFRYSNAKDPAGNSVSISSRGIT
jgi:predicted enzyme related to lactoylglutathione lyase